VNIGRGEGVTIGELATTILALMNCEKSVVLDTDRLRPANSEVFTLICDNTKARELMEWAPYYALREGLLEVIKFITAHLHLYKTGQYTI
jgi:dTDP-glucose 4,6-dehydratase